MLSEQGLTGIREARNGVEAIVAIRASAPDLVLLDVQMPRMDGFDLIQAIGSSEMPPVIFVTAFDKHAVHAFEVHAVDYLLKPIDPARLRDALERARSLYAGKAENSLEESLRAAIRTIRDLQAGSSGAAAPGTNAPADNRLAVRDQGKVHLVRPEEISWLESQGNYVTLHLRGRTLRHRATVDQMAEQLGAAFIRIRRSTLVRALSVRMCEAEGKGSYIITLDDGTRLQSSRFFRSHLSPLLDR
jgi:two-component system LytT family response regulator